MLNKRGFEFSFTWLFSIIVGAVVIFLAIYGAMSYLNTERGVQNTLNAKELEILLQPIETQSFETSTKPGFIEFPQETRIEVSCSNQLPWGYSGIKTASRQNANEQWQDSGVASVLNNKFIFAEKYNIGKKFELFTKQMTLPFKIGDLIFLWTGDYCFVNAPQNLLGDFTSLGINGSSMKLANSLSECSVGSKKVCFGGSGAGTFGSGCDVEVDLTLERVKKDGRYVYYKGPLMYGAIFSNAETYDCNIKRLMHKTASLAGLYYEKSVLISSKSQSGCSSGMQVLLKDYADKAKVDSNKSMQEIYIRFGELYNAAGNLESTQKNMVCNLWMEEFIK